MCEEAITHAHPLAHQAKAETKTQMATRVPMARPGGSVSGV